MCHAAPQPASPTFYPQHGTAHALFQLTQLLSGVMQLDSARMKNKGCTTGPTSCFMPATTPAAASIKYSQPRCLLQEYTALKSQPVIRTTGKEFHLMSFLIGQANFCMPNLPTPCSTLSLQCLQRSFLHRQTESAAPFMESRRIGHQVENCRTETLLGISGVQQCNPSIKQQGHAGARPNCWPG